MNELDGSLFGLIHYLKKLLRFGVVDSTGPGLVPHCYMQRLAELAQVLGRMANIKLLRVSDSCYVYC